jgi:hypothetical protein
MKLHENVSVVLEGERANMWDTGDEISFKGYFFINWVEDKEKFRPDFKIYFKVLDMGNHLSVSENVQFSHTLAPNKRFINFKTQHTQFGNSEALDINSLKNVI